MYSLTDYLLSLWVIVPLFVWIAAEFLGALASFQNFLARITGQPPASAQEAAQHVSRASSFDRRRPRIALRQAAHHHHPEHRHHH